MSHFSKTQLKFLHIHLYITQTNMLITKWQDTMEADFADLLKKENQTLLYFYPKDNTPGCTIEGKQFSENILAFLDHGIQIIWVSKDTPESHCKFIAKQELSIPLISDPDLSLHKQFATRGEKKMYGMISEWTIRSTFLLNSKWEILKERRNVNALWHVARVMKELWLTK